MRWILVLAPLSGCSLIFDPQLREYAEHGQRCTADTECATGTCNSGRCTETCTEHSCRDGSFCSGGFCEFESPLPVEGDLQVGLLYVGPVGDHGWTKAHDDSRAFFLDQIPGAKARYSASIAEADAPGEIEAFAARGDNVIIGTSFSFLVPIQSGALRYPDINFLICSGFETGPNLGTYFGRMYQVMYIMGALAGHMTQTNLIGLVGPVVIPETVRHINAFTLGVRSTNPLAQVMVRWVGAWFDPDLEVSSTQALVGAGADIIFGHTDTTVPMETAREMETNEGNPVYTIGYDNPDSCHFAPSRCLSSAYWNWGPMVTSLLNEMKDGTWLPSEPVWEQMQSTPDDSVVYFAPINTELVSSTVRVEVEGLIPHMTDQGEAGSIMYPFRGPVSDTTGTERIADGAYPTDEDLLRMCWFVDGVVDTDRAPGEVPIDCAGDR